MTDDPKVWVDIYKRTDHRYFRKWKWWNAVRLHRSFAEYHYPDGEIITNAFGTFKRVWRKEKNG